MDEGWTVPFQEIGSYPQPYDLRHEPRLTSRRLNRRSRVDSSRHYLESGREERGVGEGNEAARAKSRIAFCTDVRNA